MSETTVMDVAGGEAGGETGEGTISLDDYRAAFEAEHGLASDDDEFTPREGSEVESESEQPEPAQQDEGEPGQEPDKSENSKQDGPQDEWLDNLPEKFKSAGDPKAALLKSYLNLESERPRLVQQVQELQGQLRQVQELQRFQQATAQGFEGLRPEQQAYYEQKAAARNYAKTPEQLYWDDVDRSEAELRSNLERETWARETAATQCGQYVAALPDAVREHVRGELDKMAEQVPGFDNALWSGMRADHASKFFTRYVDLLRAEAELTKLKADTPKMVALAKEEALRERQELRQSKRASATAARGTPVPAAPNRGIKPAGESEIDRLWKETNDYRL